MLKELRKEFGDLAGAQSGYDCLKNAAHNTALAIFLGMRSQILYVATPAGMHAYISDGRGAYSRGLTWETTRFPELSLREIAQLNGKDITTLVFWQALQISEDVHHHHVVMDRLSREVPEVVRAVRQFYQAD